MRSLFSEYVLLFLLVSRSFSPVWYHHFPWLEYSIESNSMYCFPCRFFGVNYDPGLTATGYSDWKHARGKRGTLDTHNSSKKPKDALLSWCARDNDTCIVNQPERGRVNTIKENRQYVIYLMEVILCCAQQGIALRGHREADDEDGSIKTANFLNFLKLHSHHIQFRSSAPKNVTLLSPQCQNDMLSVLGNSVLDIEVRVARY